MSDEDYANFLSKSQKDYSKPSAKTSEPSKSGSGSSKGNKGVSGSKYSSIKNIGDDRRYVSEADEPFHEVEFDWEGSGIPDEKSFAELVGLDAQDVETLTTKQWDPKGDYEDVTKAVSEAGGGGGSSDNTVKVYKTAGSGARVIYYVVTVNEKEKKIVGVKVTAVES